MTQLTHKFIIILLLLPVIALAQVSVPNSSFEQGDITPSQWSWNVGDEGMGSAGWELNNPRSGQRAYRIIHENTTGYTALVSDFITLEPGEYRVSAWVNPTTRLSRGVYLMLSQYPPDGKIQQLPNAFGKTTVMLQPNAWQQITAKVTLREGNTRLRIHCIQAALSDIIWDDFSIEATSESAMPRYVQPSPEVLPDIETARTIVAKRHRAEALVETIDGRPRLIIDDQVVPWAFYVSPFWKPGDAQIGDFRDAGVRVYSVPLILGRGVYGDRGPWLGEQSWDFSEVDALIWRVLQVDPQAYILFYMCCDPYQSWGVENPEHVTCDQNGQKAVVNMHPIRWGGAEPAENERYGPAISSLKLRDDIAETLRRLVAHVETSEAGKAVIGYHVAGFNDGQWFPWDKIDINDPHVADYSPGAVAAWRVWLQSKYISDETLQAAWRQKSVTFSTAQPPAWERYWREGWFMDMQTDQDIADWVEFYSAGTTANIQYLAGVLKESSSRPIICGTYHEDISNGSAGHLSLKTHLSSDNLDYLAGPAAYDIRMAGYQGAIRNVFGSTMLHGKTYLTEQDWRSWMSYPNNEENNFAWGRAPDIASHNAMVWRECGMMLAYGMGTWWYDMSGGWFRDDGIMSGIKTAMEAFGQDAAIPGTPQADLAVFISEESQYWMQQRNAPYPRWHGIVHQLEVLNLAGVPYRTYLMSDLTRGDLPEHKAYLFLNAYYLTDEQKIAIENLKSDDHTLIFMHSPGAVNGIDPAQAASEITGISLKSIGEVPTLVAEALPGDHVLQIADEGEVLWYSSIPGGPALAVKDADAIALACWPGSEEIAVGCREYDDWRSVFAGNIGLSESFISRLATYAGCWRVGEPGDAIYANGNFITIHALFDGIKTLYPHQPSRIMDLTSGELIANYCDEFTINMKRGETRWFRLLPDSE